MFVVKSLSDWIQQHTSTNPDNLRTALKCDFTDEESSRLFWNTLFKLLTQGFFQQVVALLNVLADYLHAQYSSKTELVTLYGDQRSSEKTCTQWKLVQDIIMLIKQNPISRCTQFTTVELNSYAAMWRSSFQELKVIAEACDENELTTLCGLCAGERAILNKLMRDDSSSADSSIGIIFNRWFEGIVAFCIFIMPSITRQDLNKILPTLMPSTAIDRPLDHLIYALFTADNLKIVYHICSVFPDTCTAMHLVDLFYYSGYKLSSTEVSKGLKKKENTQDFLSFLIEDYGRKLMLHSSLWPFGFSYLLQLNEICSEAKRNKLSFSAVKNEGTEIVTEMIDRLEIETDQQAVALINLCLKYELQECSPIIGRKRAMYYMKKNSLLNASLWTVRCLDTEIAAKIAHECLKLYLNSGKIDQIAGVLENLSHVADVKRNSLGKSGLNNMSLLETVCKFYEYLKCKSLDGDFQQAANCLMALIRCPNLPRSLQLSLLLDSVDFVALKMINSSDDLCVLASVLEKFQSRENRFTNNGLDSRESTNDVLMALRRMLHL